MHWEILRLVTYKEVVREPIVREAGGFLLLLLTYRGEGCVVATS